MKKVACKLSTVQSLILTILAFGLVSCGSEKTQTTGSKKEEAGMVVTTVAKTEGSSEEEPSYQMEEVRYDNAKLEDPKFDLPQLPYDKSQLPKVTALDEMLKDDIRLESVYKQIYEELGNLKSKTEVSMSGTPDDIIKDVLTMVNAMRDFEAYSKSPAEQAITQFKSKYDSDSEFSEKYWQAYHDAEAEISGPTVVNGPEDFVIPDKVKRAEVHTHFRNGYSPSRSTELSSLQSLMEEGEEIRQDIINRVISGVQTDLMVADYRKGNDLVDLLNASKGRLKLVSSLDKSNEEVMTMLNTVEEKKESRLEEVQKAIEDYRFPDRYTGGNEVSNPEELEKRMMVYLEKSGYDVRDIKVASSWFAIHNVLGVLLYYQIDYYVAARYKDSNEGVLDVLYVTGKTGGPDQSKFGSYSVGAIAQMLEKNL